MNISLSELRDGFNCLNGCTDTIEYCVTKIQKAGSVSTANFTSSCENYSSNLSSYLSTIVLLIRQISQMRIDYNDFYANAKSVFMDLLLLCGYSDLDLDLKNFGFDDGFYSNIEKQCFEAIKNGLTFEKFKETLGDNYFVSDDELNSAWNRVSNLMSTYVAQKFLNGNYEYNLVGNIRDADYYSTYVADDSDILNKKISAIQKVYGLSDYEVKKLFAVVCQEGIPVSGNTDNDLYKEAANIASVVLNRANSDSNWTGRVEHNPIKQLFNTSQFEGAREGKYTQKINGVPDSVKQAVCDVLLSGVPANDYDSFYGQYYNPDHRNDLQEIVVGGNRYFNLVKKSADNELTGKVYVVKNGQNLTSIAKELGMSWEDLYNNNRDVLSSPNKIYPGQELKY